MRSVKNYALFSALLLTAFLLLRPVIGRLGQPEAPDTQGMARVTDRMPAPESVSGAPAAGPDGLAPDRPGSADEGALPVSHKDDVERVVLRLVNQERASQGLAPLQAEAALSEIARRHNQDMLSRGFFNHVNPDGRSPLDRIARHHRRLIGRGGENIWSGSNLPASDASDLAKTIVQDLMASPGHRANILRPEYTHLGVGVSQYEEEIRATQNFAAVHAYLDAPLPERAASGEALDLDCNPQARQVDLFSNRRGLASAGPFPVSVGRIEAEAGVYVLRFHFPASDGSLLVLWGPEIEVVN